MFEIRETTIDAYHAALLRGETTVLETVRTYLRRCQAIDPVLKSLICINPQAEAEAKKYDEELEQHKLDAHFNNINVKLPLLFGVPVVVKDTYATKDMPTTAGSISFAKLQTLDGMYSSTYSNIHMIIL